MPLPPTRHDSIAVSSDDARARHPRDPRGLDPSSATMLPIGNRVAGKYRVLALLERGGSECACIAVEGRSASARRLVLLETPRAEQRHSTGADAFVAEARQRQRMNHPNVTQTYDLVLHEGRPVVVAEYVEGESLATLLSLAFGMPEFTLEMRLTILAGALRGLHYIHQVGDETGKPARLVHGGLSPHDVLIGYDGSVKLAGFGGASVGLRSRSSAAIAPANLEYLAPEQLAAPSVQASDVFAMGILLWEVATLQRFWSNLPHYEIQRRLSAFDIPDVARLEPNLGSPLERICRKALAADPGLRYPSATHLLIDVERYLAERSAVAPAAAIARVMSAACGALREESRQVIDDALEAVHGGSARRSEAPSVLPFWSVLPGEPRAISTTALWAAGTLGALLIAVAARHTRLDGPGLREGRPIAGESSSGEGVWLGAPALEPEATASPEAGLEPPPAGDTTATGAAASAAARLEARASGSTTIQTLPLEPRSAGASRAAGVSGSASPARRDRSSRDGRSLEIRLER